MAIATFYHSDLKIDDQLIVLSEQESAHALRSRRLRKGDQLQVINGFGLLGKGIIQEVSNKTLTVFIERMQQQVRHTNIKIAAALPKGDRQKNMIDMLTQLGVDQIQPLNCDRSVTHYKPSMLTKWQRIAAEDCKQSQNPWLPVFSPAITVLELICNTEGVVLYADINGKSLFELNDVFGKETDDVTIIIGPEGGLSAQEMIKLKESSCHAISMGSNILRTELAAAAALLSCQASIKSQFNEC